MKLKVELPLSGVFPHLFLVLTVGVCIGDGEQTQMERIESVRQVAEQASVESIRILGDWFQSEPMQYDQSSETFLRVEVVKALGQHCSIAEPAAQQLVAIGRQFLPKATGHGFFAERYARSPEYLATTSALFEQLGRCRYSLADTFIEDVLKNSQNKYEQHASLQAARAKLIRESIGLTMDKRVASIVEHLDDGIPSPSDYVISGIRTKSASLDLAAMDILIELGSACLSHLNHIYRTLPAVQSSAAKKSGVVLAIARILAEADNGKSATTQESLDILQDYLNRNMDNGVPALGTVRWHIERTSANVQSIRADSLHISRQAMSKQDQDQKIHDIRKAVAEARRVEMARRMRGMDAAIRLAYEYVGALDDNQIGDELDRLIKHLNDFQNAELDRLILQRMGEYAARNPANIVWTSVRTGKLLDIAPQKNRQVCAEIGRVIDFISVPESSAVSQARLSSDKPNIQFAALMSVQRIRSLKMLDSVVDLVDSSDEDVRILALRILRDSGITTTGKTKAELRKAVNERIMEKSQEKGHVPTSDSAEILPSTRRQ